MVPSPQNCMFKYEQYTAISRDKDKLPLLPPAFGITLAVATGWNRRIIAVFKYQESHFILHRLTMK